MKRSTNADPSILILASLADGDKHGYAMVQDIERFAEVHLGPGTLYGELTRLEEQGWIKPLEAEERRRPYRLTAAGRSILEEQTRSLDRVIKTALRRLKHA